MWRTRRCPGGGSLIVGAQVPGDHFRGGWVDGWRLTCVRASRAACWSKSRKARIAARRTSTTRAAQRWEAWFTSGETMRVDRQREQIAAAEPRVRHAAREGRHLRPLPRRPARAERRHRAPDVRVFAYLDATSARSISTRPASRSSSAAGASTPATRRCARTRASILRFAGWTPGTPFRSDVRQRHHRRRGRAGRARHHAGRRPSFGFRG